MTAARRRIVQIAASLNEGGADGCDIIYALCDDGSAWRLCGHSYNNQHERKWTRLPDIPQGKKP